MDYIGFVRQESIRRSRLEIFAGSINKRSAEERSSAGNFRDGDFFGWSGGDDFAAVRAGFGSEIQYPVGFRGDGHVVFDDNDRVVFVDQAVQDIDEAFDVFEMEADGWFFDEIKIGYRLAGELGFIRSAFDEFGNQFDALCFAAGECGGGLAELEVTETGIGHEAQRCGDAWLAFKKRGGFLDGHGKNITDVFLVKGDFECGGVVAGAVAGFAVDPSGREEVHFEFDSAIAFAVGAAATFGVEGETRGVEAANARFGHLGEERADVVEDFYVSGGAGTGGFTDGGLVDFINGFDGLVARG